MKRFLNSFSFTVLLMVIIALGAVVTRLVAHGVFRSAPKVEILPTGGNNGTLKVVTDRDYWPYSFIDKDGNLSGREIEIAYSIANFLGMNIEIEAKEWNECIRLADFR